jgi:crossover junction endodeoxyribonuclease RuvC
MRSYIIFLFHTKNVDLAPGLMAFTTFPDRILGVDPGTQILGYAIIDTEREKLKLMTLGALKLKKSELHQDRLREIFLELQEIIEAYKPSILAIEAPFFGKNVQAMLKLGRAQGVAMAAAITMGLEIFEYSPKKVKQAVTGNGNASKEQVAAMLSHILGKPVQASHFDATDALACAVCHSQKGQTATGATTKFSSWKNYVQANPAKAKWS